MANKLTTIFELIDNFSDKLDAIANSGDEAMDKLENMGNAADSAFDNIEGKAASAASAVDGVATVCDNVQNSVDEAARALEAEEEMLGLCEQSAKSLNTAMESTQGIQEELCNSIENADELLQSYADSGDLSAKAMEQFEQANTAAKTAMDELAAAQVEAEEAMDYYDKVIMSGTDDLDELQSAADRAAASAEALTAAQTNATQATEDLSEAAAKAAKEAENGGKSGVDAIDAVASALAAAGITITIKEISESVYDMATAFSEAESTVVLATGATGDALDSLTESMMNAYSASKTGSLNDTAAAVGEINTRLGYTGESLEETTGLFTDFAAVTGGNAASSVRSVTQLMNQWNISADEMESVLSKLTYAGQASGISVDTLSSQLVNNKPILDQIGFSLDEATAMFMNFELAGTQTSTVMMGLRSALSSGAISSLEDLYGVLEQLSTGVMTTAEATEIFGSRAGPAITNAAQSGVFALDDMVDALENSSGTLETTAEAAQTLDQKWEQANKNISTAFSNVLQPSINDASSSFAEFLNGVGDFLNEHPTVVKAISAVGAVIGTVAVAFGGLSAAVTAYNAVMTVSKALNEAWGLSLTAVLGPIALVSAAVAGVVTVVSVMKDNYNKAYEESRSMTYATREQSDELERLQKEYDTICEDYGVLSTRATDTKAKIDEITSALENNGQSVDEFIEETNNLIEKQNNTIDSHDKTTQAIQDEAAENFALISRLEQLSSATDNAASSQAAMQGIITQIGDSIDGMDYDKLMDMDVGDRSEYLKNLALEQAAQKQYNADMEEFTDLMGQQDALYKKSVADAEEYNAAQKEADEIYDKWQSKTKRGNGEWDTAGMYQLQQEYEIAADKADELKTNMENSESAYQENIEQTEILAKQLGFAAYSAEDFADGVMDGTEGAAAAYNMVKASIEDLCTKYDEAYEAALASFEGQFGLFDTAEANMSQTVNATQNALDSQLSYWENYNNNLSTLTEYSKGLEDEEREKFDAMLAQINDGSAEAAGLLSDMASQINAGVEAPIEEMANTYAQISEQQQQAAATTAEWQTDFTNKMNEYATQMTNIVTNDLELSAEAKTSATTTINSYVQAILAGKDDATAAAKQVAAAVTAALSDTNISVNVTTSTNVEGNAVGTTDAADIFIAGEEGPELVVGKRGSTVFPHEETQKIIDAVSSPTDTDILTQYINNYDYSQESEQNFSRGVSVVDYTGKEDKSIFVPVGDEKVREDTSNGGFYDSGTKKLLLEISGKGSIDVSGGKVDDDTLLTFLYQYMKPVLLEMIQQEIYEEGDNSYDY